MGAPKVTLRPSEEIIQAANEVDTIVVGAMTIGLKKPGILAQYRIVEVVGDSAKNQVYMGMINPILWVNEIDGEYQPMPGTKRELEALIQRLGEDGVVAIAENIAARVAPAESAERVKN